MFELQPEFIEQDHRTTRPAGAYQKPDANPGEIKVYGYAISTEFMNQRHGIMLPPDQIQGKTVLDIGSCLGATGAWCLYHGAAHYTGVEVQQTYVDLSSQLLSKYHSQEKFTIVKQPAEKLTFDHKFDIIVASGVLYGIFNPFAFIESLTALAREQIIIESKHPFLGYRKLWGENADVKFLKDRAVKIPMIVPWDDNRMTDADSDGMYVIGSSKVSVAALDMLFKNHGWRQDLSLYHQAEQQIPKVYDIEFSDRFMTRFVPDASCSIRHFYQEIHNPDAKINSWR